MSRRARLIAVLSTITVAYGVGDALLSAHSTAVHAFADLGWTLISLAAALKCLDTSRRCREPHQRLAWRLFALGCASWFTGMLIWDWLELVEHVVTPFPAISEVGFLGIVPCCVAGFFFYGGEGPSAHASLKLAGDLGMVVCTFAMVSAIVLYHPVVAADEGPLYIGVALAYPIIHLSGLFFGLLVLWQRVWGRQRLVLSLHVLGMTVLAVVTVLYAYSLLTKSYEAGHALDVMWVLCFCLFIWAAYEEDWLLESGEAPKFTRVTADLDAVVPALAVGTVAVSTYAFRDHWAPELAPVFLGSSLGLAFFVGTRLWGSRRLERALLEEVQREETRFRQLLRDAPIGIAHVDAEGHVVFHNRPFTRLVGELEKDMPPTSDWVQSGAADRLRDTLERGRRTNTEHFLPERGKYVRLLISPLDEGGALLVARDVTDDRRLSHQLAQAQKMDAVGTLAGGFAHDMNNLLTGMITGARLLRRKLGTDDQTKDHLELMEQSMWRAAELTQHLLALSRKSEVKRQTVRPDEILRRVADLIRRGIADSIRVELVLDEQAPRVQGDPTQIEQALLNLAINACQAMPAGGRLLLSLGTEEVESTDPGGSAEGTHVVLTVEDDGGGIPDELQERVFEPFFTTKATGEGTGLGLAMVYRCAEQHGGRVRLWSRVGEGTRISLVLPAAEGEAERSDERPAEPALPMGHETVLAVDDRDAPLLAIRALLERCGYTVLVAFSGEEALDRLEHHGKDVALVLTDAVMPGMGGRAFLRALRSRGHAMPVVLLTGYEQPAESAPEDAEFAAVLSKPFEPERLARTVRELLDRAA